MDTTQLLYTVLTIVIIMGVIQGTCAFLIYVERKVSAWMQDRLGPNRVGPLGLFQSIADGLKFLLKEDIIPHRVDRFLYLLAPALAISTALLAFAVVPFGPTAVTPEEREQYQFVIAPNINIGILFVFAVASLNVYGIILGGWAANNKYSLMGAIRSSAQIISYEIPMGLAVVGVVLLTGSLNLERIIAYQADGGPWFFFYQPLAFLLFMIASFAECNRLPFDLPEAEQELIGGYHTEYSALKFALFFLGEYTHMITTSFLMVILFFGGWHFPWIATAESFWFVKLLMFALKMAFFIVFFMLIRWTIPRFRFDQLMNMAWKVLIPLALLNLLAVMIVQHCRLSPWWLLPVSILLFFGAGLFALLPSPSPKKVLIQRETPEPLETAP
jgi:NADH-quinone oxidoreductase subunit H